MGYFVRLLTPSGKVVPASEIWEKLGSVKLTRGMDSSWEQIEVFNAGSITLASVERHPVYPGSSGESELTRLKDMVSTRSPASAREWLRKYFEIVKTIYTFQLSTDNITKKVDWQILGRVQNYLKDALGGIIQADNEGFYNENGDYILWQMYPEAAGTIPAATLDANGQWVTFHLKLNDEQAVEKFKQGEMPRRGLFDILFKK